jgi:hypothetical protein
VLSFFSHASSPSILTEERFSPFSAEAKQYRPDHARREPLGD